MNYGLYVSASGVLTNTYRQDVFANNLANSQTVGFKVDMPMIRQRQPESMEDRAGFDLSHELLDQLGGGVLASQQRLDMTNGEPTKTGRPYDLALTQPNTFFAVAIQDTATGATQVRLTRDGRFTRDNDGFLVTMAGGHKVLNQKDQPVRIPEGNNIAVDNLGRIVVDGEEVDTMQVTAVNDPHHLIKQGQNLLAWEDGKDQRRTAGHVEVLQGFVESSSVDPVQALMQLVSATKAISGNANMIRYHDQLMDRAINTLGRVA